MEKACFLNITNYQLPIVVVEMVNVLVLRHTFGPSRDVKVVIVEDNETGV